MTSGRNPEKTREYQRRYYEKNRERVKTAVRQRNSVLRSTGQRKQPTWDPEQSAAARLQPVMSYEEIAALLGISKARVGQLVEKALRKLRARFPTLRELLR